MNATHVVDMVPVSCITDPIDLLASTVIHDLPPGCPSWAARLRDCEVTMSGSIVGGGRCGHKCI